jgi:hypothetical protein
MKPLKWIFTTFPALSRAALIGSGLTLALLIGLRIAYHDARPSLFFLGDSGIGNYRLDPGLRLQDALQRSLPEMRVENWAEPGATPLDYYLQWHRAALAAGKPAMVVVAMEHSKFMNEACPHRFDEDGVNLRWLPWSRNGAELFGRLTAHERNVALVQQASVPFYAAADVGRLAWIRYLQWPSERKRMRNAGPERRKKIEAKAAELGKSWDTIPVPDDSAFAALPRARDGEFLFKSLRDAGIRTRVLLLPYGNPDMLAEQWSPNARARLDSVAALMRRWLDAHGVEYIDLNAPEERAHFPNPVWDDLQHIKDPAAFAYMAERVRATTRTPP